MLLDSFKTKEGKEHAAALLEVFTRTGNPSSYSGNFIERNESYIRYELNGDEFAGFFSMQERETLFSILNYYPGKILVLNG